MYQSCKRLEKENEELFAEIQKKVGYKETETGLAPSSQWDLKADEIRVSREQNLIVARCLKIYKSQPTEEDKILGNETHEDVEQTTKYTVNLRYVVMLFRIALLILLFSFLGIKPNLL